MLQELQCYKRPSHGRRCNLVTLLTLLTFPIILNSHWVAHPPGGGHPLLFFPFPNPFPESRRRKSSAAHPLLAGLRSSGHRASPASASQSSHPVFPQDCRLRTTIRPSR